MLDQTRDARREHSRFSRPGAGDYEKRAFEMENGLALSGIEPREWLRVTR
jgi:hypothetical protein